MEKRRVRPSQSNSAERLLNFSDPRSNTQRHTHTHTRTPITPFVLPRFPGGEQGRRGPGRRTAVAVGGLRRGGIGGLLGVAGGGRPGPGRARPASRGSGDAEPRSSFECPLTKAVYEMAGAPPEPRVLLFSLSPPKRQSRGPADTVGLRAVHAGSGGKPAPRVLVGI